MKHLKLLGSLLALPLFLLAFAPENTSAQAADVDEISVSELSPENRALIPVDNCPRGMSPSECAELESLREFVLKHTQLVLGRQTSAVHFFAQQRMEVRQPPRLHLRKELDALRGVKHNIENDVSSRNRRLLNRRNFMDEGRTVRSVVEKNRDRSETSSDRKIPEYGRNSIIPPGMRTVREATTDREKIGTTSTVDAVLFRRNITQRERVRNTDGLRLEEKSVNQMIQLLEQFESTIERLRVRGANQQIESYENLKKTVRNAICERDPDARRGLRQTGERICTGSSQSEESREDQGEDVPLELQLDME